MFVVFDLDGTLALDQHRRHWIDGTDAGYDAYYAACPGDLPHVPAILTLEAHLLAGHRVEIWTGRRRETEPQTRAWLRAHLGILPIADLRVLMRAPGDHRDAVAVKRDWLRALGHQDRPELAYDDRDDCAAMWRAEGVTCFQVAGRELAPTRED